jgi:hypothetical protein
MIFLELMFSYNDPNSMNSPISYIHLNAIVNIVLKSTSNRKFSVESHYSPKLISKLNIPYKFIVGSPMLP